VGGALASRVGVGRCPSRGNARCHEGLDVEVTVAAQVGGKGFNGSSTFSFFLAGDAIARMTIRA
jgi:hypothetical protein